MLIRALEPTHGLAEMRRRRHREDDLELCSGPGKLTEALGVGLDSNGADLSSDPFLILPRRDGWSGEIVTGPRVGITKAVGSPLALLPRRQPARLEAEAAELISRAPRRRRC